MFIAKIKDPLRKENVSEPRFIFLLPSWNKNDNKKICCEFSR